ncbi:murein biosynthesis integral membrane protein MurJ [Herbiconiux sp. YIM B11900]|uniref:murein biosynthesis integral membrane protein MurJ n=1 Tax=Herbiconiux sp. YIM B11900 TaxID=3404131 RepID=UPI003F871AE2
MAGGTLASRVSGFAKATLLIYAIGATSSAVGGQAFDVANSAPTFLYGLIAGGILGAILVPQITHSIADGRDGRNRLDRLLTLTLLGAVVVTAALTTAAPLIVMLYAAGWTPAWLALATSMAYWCLPQVFFFILYTVLAQVLNAHDRFAAAAWAPVVSNLTACGGIVVFLIVVPTGLGSVDSWTPGMVALIAGSATLGVVMQSLVLLPSLRAIGFRFRPRLGFTGLGAATRIAAWTFLAVLAGQLAYVVVSNVAATAGQELNKAGIDGASLNTLSLAYMLVLLPHGIATVSLATAMFTSLSRAANARDYVTFQSNLQRTGSLVTLTTLPVAIALAALGPWITQIVWGSPIIGTVLQPLAIGLIGFSQTFVLNRALFALHRGFQPFINQAIAAFITATGATVIGVSAPPEMRVIDIAIVVILSNTMSWLIAHLTFRASLRRLGVEVLPHTHARLQLSIWTAAATAALVAWALVIASSSWAQQSVTEMIISCVGIAISIVLTFAAVTVSIANPSRLRELLS